MRLVYITLARKILCYGSFPAKVLLGTNAYNSQNKKPVINSIYNEQIKLMTGRKEYYNVYRLRLEIQLKIMVQT